MERNWLIRTSQNQILGPVAKAKLLEFIQKGALGMTDEVASGNGYWFSLKEKELVEKYLYGDIPQGYNPISESKSVLARRENPDKTSSINTAPVNNNATQVIKLSSLAPGLVPKNEDLEFPEVSAPPTKTGVPVLNLDSGESENTLVIPKLDKSFKELVVESNSSHTAATEELKLPASDDLEFPDVGAITSQVDQSFKYPGPDGSTSVNHNQVTAPKKAVQAEVLANGEEIILPDEDDLAFPDMEEKTSTKVEKGKVDLAQQYTRTVALDEVQAAQILPEIAGVKASASGKAQQNLESDLGEMQLSLDKGSKHSNKEEPAQSLKKEKVHSSENVEEKKLLHERKIKSSARPAAQRDPTREVAHVAPAEPLKKRNDNYIFFILIILILIIVAVFFYFKEILNKPLPV